MIGGNKASSVENVRGYVHVNILRYYAQQPSKYVSRAFPWREPALPLRQHGQVVNACGSRDLAQFRIRASPALPAVGFSMRFSPKSLAVHLNPEMIPRLLQRVRDICDLNMSPRGRPGRRDCMLPDAMTPLNRLPLRARSCSGRE
jgi:hypothetical protein